MARIDPLNAYEFERTRQAEIQNSVETNSILVEEVVNEIVSRYSQELDNLIDEVHKVLLDHGNIENYELDIYIAKIPVLLYYVTSAQESVGVREDVSRMIRQKLYIQARQSATGTVADKDSIAERAVEQETISAAAYARASKKLKHKCETALELLSALKKIISRRMEEYRVTQIGKDD